MSYQVYLDRNSPGICFFHLLISIASHNDEVNDSVILVFESGFCTLKIEECSSKLY